MSKILAIETSSEACSVALLLGRQIQQKFIIAPQQHTQLVLTMVNTLLIDAALTLSHLDGIAFGCGPGSFTGIRIAAGIVQGLAFSCDLPVMPISSLQAMAQGAFRETGAKQTLVCLDARVQQIYWGVYSLDRGQRMVARVSDSLVNPNEAWLPPGNHWTGIGNGWEIYRDALTKHCHNQLHHVESDRYPQAFDVAALAQEDLLQGKAVAAEQALPVYLRGAEAWKKQTR